MIQILGAIALIGFFLTFLGVALGFFFRARESWDAAEDCINAAVLGLIASAVCAWAFVVAGWFQ